jgi:hypothetical protein
LAGVAGGLGAINRGVRGTNFNPALRQWDQLTKRINANKMSLKEYRALQKEMNRAASQQTRLSRAVPAMQNGMWTGQMLIPGTKHMNNFSAATEQANRKLSMQGQTMKALGTQMVDWGKNTQWAGRQLMVGFTMPFVAAMAAVGVMAYKVDKKLVQIEKVYDGSTKGLRKLALETSKAITTLTQWLTLQQLVSKGMSLYSQQPRFSA